MIRLRSGKFGIIGAATASLLAAAALAVDDFKLIEELKSALAPEAGEAAAPEELPAATVQRGVVNCATLVYGNNKSSQCFSEEFLSQIARDTHISTNPQMVQVGLDSPELFQFPFAVMTGEGAYALTPEQRTNMRSYLEGGGFIIASAGCSSDPWQASFRQAVSEVFPELKLTQLEPSHPVFHTVYEISTLQCKGSHTAHLEGLEIDGKIVLIFSPDGLNDTGKAGGNCCCCGGDEIKNARQMNVNLLAYTLTH